MRDSQGTPRHRTDPPPHMSPMLRSGGNYGTPSVPVGGSSVGTTAGLLPIFVDRNADTHIVREV